MKKFSGLRVTEEPKTSDQSNELPDWVRELRNRSWEMELLLAGFVLFGLIAVPDLLGEHMKSLNAQFANSNFSSMIIIFLGLLYIGIKILIVNLIAHLALRGYWIGIIGLGSVYPAGVNFERLPYSPNILGFLKRKVPDFEKLALRLDNICSSIFSFTFLIFFMFISIAWFFIILVVLVSIFEFFLGFLPFKKGFEILMSGILILFLLGGVLTVIDFLSLGLLKRIKKKWFSSSFLVLIKVFGIITLSFLYEPIYYNLISNLSKKVIGSVILGYVGVIFCVFNFGYNETIFFPNVSNDKGNLHVMKSMHYENLMEPSSHILIPLIQSNIIQDEPLTLFIPIGSDDNNALREKFPNLHPLREEGVYSRIRLMQSERGYGFHFGDGDLRETKDDLLEVLDCLKAFYPVSLDGAEAVDLNFMFYEHPHFKEPGILAYIATNDLDEGEHLLTVTKSMKEATVFTIPFWLNR